MSRNTRKQSLGFYGQGRFFMVYYELLESFACRVLTPIQKVVLFDYLRFYGRLSNGGRERLPDGLQYAWSVCDVDIAESTFHKARKRLQAVGFIEFDPAIQEGRPGAPNRYRPSRKWAEYEPSSNEQKKLQQRVSRKGKRIKKKGKRRTKFREALNTNGESTPHKSGRHPTRGKGRRNRLQSPTPSEIEADTTPELPPIGHSESGRPYICHVGAVPEQSDTDEFPVATIDKTKEKSAVSGSAGPSNDFDLDEFMAIQRRQADERWSQELKRSEGAT